MPSTAVKMLLGVVGGGAIPAPGAPTLTAPTSGATLTDTTPDITWNAVTGATTYEVQIATDSGFTSLVSLTGATGITGTSYTVAGALTSFYTLYYVHVRAVNAGGNSAYSSAVSFYVADMTLLNLWINPESGLYTDDPAVTPATTDGALVRTAQDQSGSSNHATAASDAARFTLKTGANGINGRPVLRSDGTNSLMTTTSFLSASHNKAFTALFVVRGDPTTGTTPKVFAGNSGNILYFGRDQWEEYFRFQNVGGTTKMGYSQAPGNRLWIGIASYDGTTLRVMLNGNYKSVASTANIGASGALTLGDFSTGGFKYTWDIGEVKIWQKGLTLVQMQNLAAWAAIRYNAALCTKRIICEGDSLTYGVNPAVYTPYPTQLEALYNDPGVYVFNVGQNGAKIAGITTDAATQVTVVKGTNIVPVLVVWCGTNNLHDGSSTAQQTYDAYVAYCQARQAEGIKVVATTILPRSDTLNDANFETNRITVNANIRANWNVTPFADALADFAADSRIGDAGDETNTTYFNGDNCHMTNTGYGVIAAIAKTAIDLVA